jgi:glycosyltransferase involved in cell wall biosynthesis
MTSNLPLISCICITKNKPAVLKRSIDCFKAQSYENKELIVVYESDDALTKESVAEYSGQTSIRFIEVPSSPKRTLGYLRNYAIDLANGEFICQWDDDDWYHVKRLEDQLKMTLKSGYSGCIMTQWLVFDGLLMKSYISNERRWEGTIFCKKDKIKLYPYLDQRAGEDTAVIEYLFDNNYITSIQEVFKLYIYVYHGNNTCDREHWECIFKASKELDESQTRIIHEILQQGYSVEEGSTLLDQILTK